ncbi:alpha/beta hydrolase [Clostridiaceae bacterium M8S5]|nr:alpha/beta hydrolase [Clostridiaceae bacterium M8S5]
MIALILIVVIIFFPTYTPKIRDNNFKVIENSIAELSTIKLGGINQTIMIRGVDKNKPIMLFLHGGPGYPFISYARKYQSKLEKNFVVVNWDQRGSGKSYSLNMSREKMTQEQLEKDTQELIEYLCDRFNKDKIFIVGHSWGTVLGIEAIKKLPDKVMAYVGIGQVIDDVEGERLSYRYVYNKAIEEYNDKAIKELEQIGQPPYKNSGKDTFIQRKWLKKYGGFELDVITQNEMIKGVLFSPEYSLIDGIKLLAGNKFSINTLFVNREKADFREKYQEFDVPIYFIAGRHDHNTPSELVEQYYNTIKAPRKNFYWFEESAHEPHLVEEDKFAKVMMEIYNETK